jgi:hypothetical protein
MSSLRAIALAIWGLLVEDGSLAAGIIIALGLTWLAATLLPEPLLDQVGWLLLAMLVVLVIVNLRAAGLRARRHVPGALG